MPRVLTTARTIALALVLALLAPPRARAHPVVDQGTRELDRARFAAAIEAFDRAAARDDLSVAALVVLLEGRALAHRALGDERASSADLARLAAIRPDHEPSVHVPPEIAQAFRALRDRRTGPIRARVSVVAQGGVAVVCAQLIGDPGGLVRGVRVAARSGGAWVEGDGEVAIVPRGAVDVHVEVIALGGARIVEYGSREVPLPLVIAGTDFAAERSDDPWPWIAGASGIVLGAIAIGVAIGVASSAPSEHTMLTPPRLVGPVRSGLSP